METTINNAGLIKVKAQLFKSYIDNICNIQSTRILLGYTQQELSFLLGKPQNYVSDIETFTPGKEYTVTDIFRMSQIFKCDPKYLLGENFKSDSKVEVGVYQYLPDEDTQCTEAYLFMGDKNRVLYTFMEDISYKTMSDELRKSLINAVISYSESYSFNGGAEACGIFLYSRNLLKNKMRPQDLQLVLNLLVRIPGDYKLKTIIHDGRVKYVRIQPQIKECEIDN
ncbi:helix-turn-helix domain-containing protein [Pedobacter sp. AW31-3R]|uniref:helix-turn-helix domain-containing protein n=1 Tax=Pedobacter sp. AW31-3R TaxID=3445781 RepID=UPI003F9FF7AB